MARTRARGVWALIPAIAASFAAPREAPADPEPSYPKRLEMIDDLGRRYPGFIAAAGGTYREIGLWAGIAIQTAWQKDSGRTELPLWERVNYSLTVTPFDLAKRYESDEQCQDDLCRAWYDYFKIAANPRRSPGSPYWADRHWRRPQRALWKAHERSIGAALEQYRRDIDDAFRTAPDPEKYFWRGWVRTVPALAWAVQPTFDEAIARQSAELFPSCSPLRPDAPCTPSELTPASIKNFVWLMIARGKALFDPGAIDPSREPWYTLPPQATRDLAVAPEETVGATSLWQDRPIDSQRRGALLSAYFFAYQESDSQLDEAVRPIPLADAARVLQDDESPLGLQRRRRAIALLAAAGHSDQRSRALEILGFPVASIPLPFRAPPANDAERFEREDRILGRLSAGVRNDCETERVVTRFHELEGGALRAEYKTKVHRSPDQLRKALDPQSWPQCSDFFRSTCIVDAGESEGIYVPDLSPPSPGSSYADRLLFEHFVFDLAYEWVGLRNILQIDSNPSPTVHEVTYELERAMSTDLPTRKQGGGLSVDEGHLHAGGIAGRSGWSALDFTKAIEFDHIWAAPLFNLLRKPTLRLLADEIQASACCEPRAPDPNACVPMP